MGAAASADAASGTRRRSLRHFKSGRAPKLTRDRSSFAFGGSLTQGPVSITERQPWQRPMSRDFLGEAHKERLLRSTDRAEEVIGGNKSGANRQRAGRKRFLQVDPYDLGHPASILGHTAPDSQECKWIIEQLDEQNHLFRLLACELKERVAGVLYTQKVQAGEVLFRQHEKVSTRCFLLADGVLSETKQDKQDGADTSRLLQPGSLFGELALLYSTPRYATIKAQTDATLYVLSRAAYSSVLMQGGKVNQQNMLVRLRSQVPFFLRAPGKKLQKIAFRLEKVHLDAGVSLSECVTPAEAAEGVVFLQTEQSYGCMVLVGGERMKSRTLVAICSHKTSSHLGTEVSAWNKQHNQFLKAIGELGAARQAEVSGRSSHGSVESTTALHIEGHALDDLDDLLAQAIEDFSQTAHATKQSKLEDSVQRPQFALAPAPSRPASAAPLRRPSNAANALELVPFTLDEPGKPTKAMPVAPASGTVLHKISLPTFRRLISEMYQVTLGIQSVRHVAPFAGMSFETLEVIERQFSARKNYVPSEKILLQDCEGSELYLLLSGEAVVTVVPEGGGSVTVCTRLHAGDLFGELGALEGTRRTATVTAATTCTCAVFRYPRSLPSELLSHLTTLKQSCEYVTAEGAMRFNDLQYLTELGQGGYGTVLLCGHKPTERAVALKVMKRSRMRTQRQQDNVLGERRRLVELRHPFVVRLLVTFKDSVSLMVGMEYLAGGELFSVLDSLGALSHEQTLFVLASVTLMLEYVHSRSFVYRDLKPENVMLSADGFLKLVDFGFCKRLNGAERTFTPCGTPEYVAPEVTTLQGYGQEADWWTLGVLTYDCLHTYTPFSKEGTLDSDMETMANIRNPNFVVDWDPCVDRELRSVCMRLLNHNVSARYSAAEVRAHVACAEIDFQALVQKRVKPPFELNVKSDFDVSNFQPELDDGVTGASLFALEASYTVNPDDWAAEW